MAAPLPTLGGCGAPCPPSRPPAHPRLPPLALPLTPRRLSLLKALGPITVCIISIALMNIFKW